jgi:hypothetical protein
MVSYRRMHRIQSRNVRTGNAGRLPEPEALETRAGSGAGSHESGEDVVRMTVQVLAGSVVAHGGARVGMAGCDLGVPEIDASIEIVVTNVCRL